jgi:4-amino-4-deoxy-L-arabinose transferase-like glycosyltransferase
LRDRGVLLLIVLTIMMQVFSHVRSEGYNQGDTVEYLDIARTLHERGTMVSNAGIYRPPGFPLLLSTLYPIVEVLFGNDLRPVMALAKLMMAAIGVGLVLVTFRIGTHLGGRRAGLVAGLLVVANPVVMRFALDPIADPLAALLLALGVERLMVKGSRGRALAGGVLCGLACMVAFKAIPLVLLIAFILLLRDIGPRFGAWMSFLAGLLAMLAAQYALDRVVYGEWGYSIENYFWQSFGFLIPGWLFRLGFRSQASQVLIWMQEELYNSQDHSTVVASVSHVQNLRTPPTWYLTRAPRFFLVWSAVPFLLLGAWQCLRRPSWPRSIALAAVLGYLLVLSGKDSKAFRLWIPALPLLAPLCALGWEAIRGGGETPPLRKYVAWGLLIATFALGIKTFERRGPRLLGGYWQAVTWLDERVARDVEESGDARVHEYASDYGYTTRFRSSPLLNEAHLPMPLAEFPDIHPEEPEGVTERRLEMMKVVFGLDWLVISEFVLRMHPQLRAVLNPHFTVEAAFLDDGHDDELGAVYVLRRADPELEGRRFFRIAAEGEAWSGHLDFDAPPLVSFARKGKDGSVPAPESEVIELLEFDYEKIPGTGLQWMNWTWRARTNAHSNYIVLCEATLDDGEEVVFEKQRPAYGLDGIYGWDEGELVSHGELMRRPNGTKLTDTYPVRFCAIVGETREDGSLIGWLTPFGHAGSHLVRSGYRDGLICLGRTSSKELPGD